jgi:hypothetical protein
MEGQNVEQSGHAHFGHRSIIFNAHLPPNHVPASGLGKEEN